LANGIHSPGDVLLGCVLSCRRKAKCLRSKHGISHVDQYESVDTLSGLVPPSTSTRRPHLDWRLTYIDGLPMLSVLSFCKFMFLSDAIRSSFGNVFAYSSQKMSTLQTRPLSRNGVLPACLLIVLVIDLLFRTPHTCFATQGVYPRSMASLLPTMSDSPCSIPSTNQVNGSRRDHPNPFPPRNQQGRQLARVGQDCV
jgi:hypothetical protein